MGDSGRGDQTIALPKGGGAVQGIGEKFSATLSTGTGNFSIPIALPPGRNGFQPRLALDYSTGAGNGPFGLGWSLSVPAVARKTSKGVPQYDDRADVFILSGAEDLVPVEVTEAATRYQPRTEGLFARILHISDGTNSHWDVRTKDGLQSVYGTPESRGHDPAVIADPSDRRKAFAWKLTRTEDPFGNRIEYEYERDSAEEGGRHWDQLYLKQIRYGDFAEGGATKFLVSVTFEYELGRQDSFSEYRAGFEIRTQKRCTRIVIRTHADVERKVRTYELAYVDERPDSRRALPINGVSLLSTVTVIGHDGEETQALPALDLGYTAFEPRERDFFPLSGEGLPARSLADGALALVDLFGQGLPDILEMNGPPRYWRNRGGTFDMPRPMSAAPSALSLADPSVQLLDANGDGRMDLLVTNGALSGYFPLRFGGLWDERSFQRYAHAPSFSLEDPEVRLLDIDGDGVIDAMRSGTHLECFFNHPEEGWHRTRHVDRRALADFPNVSFSDPRVRLADMSGDGLQDIVLIHDGSIEYWPNLGHGNWGKRLRMDHCPRFPFRHDPKRVLLGDVDGDGLADLVYVEDGKVTLWINRGGNGFSDPVEIVGTPGISDVDSVRLVDMLGSGVAGLLWSRDRSPDFRRDSLLFLDFTGGRKPYLLNEVDNHIGAVTRVEYAPSTRFYLEDLKKLATQWKTTLPFPVQVVARVETIDALSQGKLTTEYRYHHGYWDGAEREFYGFGMVEQIDTESFERYGSAGLHGEDASFVPVSRKYFSPPTLTRTWFHLGAVGDDVGEWEEFDGSPQYWTGDAPMLGHTESVRQFLKSRPITPNARRVKRDALRCLRGSVLRSELYALDGSIREELPYSVIEHAYALREESAPALSSDRRRIFFPYKIAQRTTQWERGTDPMTQFGFTDDYDAFGQPRLQIAIACPRGWRALDDRPAPGYLATTARATYGAPIDSSVYIHDRNTQSIRHELRDTAGKTIAELEQQARSGVGLGLIGHDLHFYDGVAFEGLPFGRIGAFGARVRSEVLTITDEHVDAVYGAERPPCFAADADAPWPVEYPAEFRAALPPRAGYLRRGTAPHEAGFYVAERCAYDFQQGPGGKGLVVATRDRMGNETAIAYDAYGVLPETVTDAAGLQTVAVHDYRLLSPARITDPNGNTSEVTFTPLGLVAATFVRGKNGEGDRTRASVVMEYGLHAFEESPPENRQPIFLHTTRRIHYEADLDVPASERDAVIESYEYSDGFGRLLQSRVQAEDAIYGDGIFGRGALSLDQVIRPGDFAGSVQPANVVVSGFRTFDNKGRVVEQFEPFFSSGWKFRSASVERDEAGRDVSGRRTSTFYDPCGRVVRTVNPDQSEVRVVFGVPGAIAAPDLGDPSVFEPTPWEAYTYDANDNVGRTHASTSVRYAYHADTPSSVTVDALGRAVEAVARNRRASGGPIEELRTRATYDIRGNVLANIDALGRAVVRYSYDLASHRLCVDSLDAGRRTAVFDAGDGLIEQRGSKGSWILQSHDKLRRPSLGWAGEAGATPALRARVEYGDGGTPSQPPAERAAQRAKNRLGKVHRQYDGAGELTFEAYDFRSLVLEKTRRVIRDEPMLAVLAAPPPDWQVRAFQMNWEAPAGTTRAAHAAAHLEATGHQTSATYDALGRPKRMVYPADVDGERKELVPHYNRAGALERVTLGGDTYVERIAYNAKGQRTLIAYGNGVMTAHAYDPDTFRLRRRWTGRYERLEAAIPTYRPTAPERPLHDLGYDYDVAGNILRIADRTPGSGVANTAQGEDALDREYRHDALYRLVSASGRESIDIPAPRLWTDASREGFNSGNHGTTNQGNAPQRTRLYTEEYQYDPVGNLLSLKHRHNGTAWVRQFGSGGLSPQDWQEQWSTHFANLAAGAEWDNPPGNRLTHAADDQDVFPQTHFYDPNGNLTRETLSRHLEWDPADRLVSFRVQTGASEPSVHVQYLYDAAGQRVKKLARRQGGQITTTVSIDGVFESHSRADGGVTLRNNTLHVMDAAERIALVRVGPAFPDDATPAIAYQFGDHLGGVSLVIDGAGAWINREEFTPYGETTFGSAARKRYRFAGKERDEESGLYYFGFRYYAPWLGRWASTDPLGTADGLNLYAYARNDPLGRRDPTGLDSTPEPTSQETAAQMSIEGGSSSAPPPAASSSSASPSAAAQSESPQSYAPPQPLEKQPFTPNLKIVGTHESGDLIAEGDVPDSDLSEAPPVEPNPESPEPDTPCMSDYVRGVGMPVGSCDGPRVVGKVLAQRIPVVARAWDLADAVRERDALQLTLAVLPPLRPLRAGPGGRARLALDAVKETEAEVLHGPFTHQINKGGLDSIIREGQLMSTSGRYGDEAVRAVTHEFRPLGDGGRPVIEFYTRQAPSTIHPTNQWVYWYMQEGERLDIIVTRIAHSDGSVSIFPR